MELERIFLDFFSDICIKYPICALFYALWGVIE